MEIELTESTTEALKRLNLPVEFGDRPHKKEKKEGSKTPSLV